MQGIDIVDPDWDKGLIVSGIGFGVMIALASSVDEDAVPGLALLGGLIVVAGGTAIAMDRSKTEPIYERPSQTPRVTIAPSLGRDQKGILVHVRF